MTGVTLGLGGGVDFGVDDDDDDSSDSSLTAEACAISSFLACAKRLLFL